MGRPGGPGPLDPIFDVPIQYGAIATGNSSGVTPLTCTINQAVGQIDPAFTAPIVFTVVFSEATSDFTTGDVTITGGSGGSKTATVIDSGDHINFTVNVTGMTTTGTVVASIAAGVCHADSSGTPNLASTSTDNSVLWEGEIPAGFGNLQAWYDASNAGSLTLSGSEVTQWNDLSGNAHHLTRPFASGPTSGVRTRNGLNVLDFNADGLFNLTYNPTSTIQIFVVCVQDTTPGGLGVSTVAFFSGFDDNGVRIASTQADFLSSGGTESSGPAYTNGNWRQITGQYQPGANNQVLRENGVTVDTDTGGGINTSNAFSVGALIGGTRALDGAIAEIIIYSVPLGTTDRATIEAYLAAKWGSFP